MTLRSPKVSGIGASPTQLLIVKSSQPRCAFCTVAKLAVDSVALSFVLAAANARSDFDNPASAQISRSAVVLASVQSKPAEPGCELLRVHARRTFKRIEHVAFCQDEVCALVHVKVSD